MSRQWRVPLPRGAEPPYEVWVNGVPQSEGEDYEIEGRELLFSRCLTKEGKLGFWRWLSMALSVAGTYRQNDSIDVRYRREGSEHLAVRLDIVPPEDGG